MSSRSHTTLHWNGRKKSAKEYSIDIMQDYIASYPKKRVLDIVKPFFFVFESWYFILFFVSTRPVMTIEEEEEKNVVSCCCRRFLLFSHEYVPHRNTCKNFPTSIELLLPHPRAYCFRLCFQYRP